MGDVLLGIEKRQQELADNTRLVGVVGLLRRQPCLGNLFEADMMGDIAAGRSPIAVGVFEPGLIGLHRQQRGLPLIVGAEAASRPAVAEL